MSNLLAAWTEEPSLHDEREYTAHATPGWLSWNGMSPERDFCDFAGLLVRLLQPRFMIETGVGQGFTTRRILAALPTESSLLCFESDGPLRAGLLNVMPLRATLSTATHPTVSEFASADLTILDSDPPWRFVELERWWDGARSGTVLLAHDCGNGHAADSLHVQIRDAVAALDCPGAFLGNPRGGFLGIHP